MKSAFKAIIIAGLVNAAGMVSVARADSPNCLSIPELEADRLSVPFHLRPKVSPEELDQRIKELELRVQDLKRYE